MDLFAAAGGALVGAALAIHLGYWIGRRDRKTRAVRAADLDELRDVALAAQEFVDSDLDIEVTIEERDDPEDVARFIGLWERLEASAKRTRARLTTR